MMLVRAKSYLVVRSSCAHAASQAHRSTPAIYSRSSLTTTSNCQHPFPSYDSGLVPSGSLNVLRSTLQSSPCHSATPDLHDSVDQPFCCRFQAQDSKSRKRGSQCDYRSLEAQDWHVVSFHPFLLLSFSLTKSLDRNFIH